MSADKCADTKRGKSLPGSLWKCHGAWHWRVALPGAERRRDYTLTLPFTGERIPESASRSLAESAAWHLWENAAMQAAGGNSPVFTVNDLCDRWAAHATVYYAGSKEAVDTVRGLRMFRRMFGRRPVEAMTHPDMIAYRNALAAKGYVRTTVNKYLGFAKRMFIWALDERLVSAQTKAECTAIAPLKPHRGSVKESKPIEAVPDDAVERTCAALLPHIADMVRVHRLCGARPDEMCQLHWQHIEKRGDVWIFRPHHKNEWRNKPRVIVLGPRAQAILARHEGDGYVFAPLRGGKERWRVESYNHALVRAENRAGVAHWHPNQLRHTCATEVRRKFGIEAASAVLGHTLGLRITNRYSFEAAEDEIIKAATPAMVALG